MTNLPPDPPPRSHIVDVLLLTIAALMALVLVYNLVDFGRLVWGAGHC